MRALVIDAYDSFVYTIVNYLESLDVDVTVARNDKIAPAQVLSGGYDFVVLGPGPGHPKDSGYVEIVKAAGSSVPVFGICLGHQAIGMAFGAKVDRAQNLMHGKTSLILSDSMGVFSNHPERFHATRYHSLVVEAASVPASLVVSATDADDGYVMALRHQNLPVESVQFHPESILTEQGIAMFRSFIATHVTPVDEFN
jgi:anthranilate synthase/aminodeoxychorismate synthase-like glutamine amidotransferase